MRDDVHAVRAVSADRETSCENVGSVQIIAIQKANLAAQNGVRGSSTELPCLVMRSGPGKNVEYWRRRGATRPVYITVSIRSVGQVEDLRYELDNYWQVIRADMRTQMAIANSNFLRDQHMVDSDPTYEE